MTADCANSSNLLLCAEPLLNEQLLFVQHSHVHGQMTEVPGQLASGAANGDHTGIDLAGNALGELDGLVAVDLSHSSTKKETEIIIYRIHNTLRG